MNVSDRNELFRRGQIDREDLWPKRVEYEHKAHQFRFWFGLEKLPEEPGLIFLRGPRQFGKSTWLELVLSDTLHDFGPGSAYFLNGDEIRSVDEFVVALEGIAQLFPKTRKVRRLFIDEVTAVQNWERAFKIVLDRGILRDTLIVTTGSKAQDIRRGTERLPGRKGRLARTDYVFLPVPFKYFIAGIGKNTLQHYKIDDLALIYLISGGSPLALNDLIQFDTLPEYLITIVRDWILGEVASSGRNRAAFLGILSALFRYGGTPVGFAKLARETGMANNTVAAGYIELLSDLLCVLPSWPWDPDKDVFIRRRPCKFHFVNMAAAIAFHPSAIRCAHDFEQLPPIERSKFIEWMIASELYRRNLLRSALTSEELGFYSSEKHEIDFVDSSRDLYEVKLGASSPIEFGWVSKTIPNKRLTVISKETYMTDHIKSQTLAQWLFDCDLDPWPYASIEPWSPFMAGQ